MRAGLSTIQQTLTPEAATVLNQSIAEAARRNHGQTTPLHVAATLLASPAGFLRRACIRSHPNSSHPLQCRALELCFSVALERLPTATTTPGNDPPISNALMAALKRAQAHQRRGCPEQQQQPLLAVKVELEQLIISILDDPSVSRVMREASFSSPAVKATIEQSLNNSVTPTPIPSVSSVGLNFRPGGGGPMTRNSYLNPRLQQNASSVQSGVSKNDDVERVMDILGRAKKKNPVLVGDSEPGRVIREILKKIEVGEVGNLAVKNSKVVSLEEISSDKALRIKELDGLLQTRLKNSDPIGGGGVILDLGDLKWLVEQPSSTQPPATVAVEIGRTAVVELRRLLEKFEGRLWFIGTATCETYLRCQVYHPSVETDWDLQAVSVAAKAPASGVFPRLANNLESFTPLKSFVPANRTLKCCPQCLQSYERELAEIDSVSSPEVKSEVAQPKQLPQWLLKAKPVDRLPQAKIEEVQKKWNDACVRLHPSFHNKNERIVPIPVPITLTTSPYSPNMLLRQPLQPKLQPNRELRERVHLKPMSPLVAEQAKKKSPPGSPVQTDLVLGRAEDSEKAGDVQVRDFLGCISSESVQNNNNISVLQKENLGNSLDIDLFKKLLKGMTEKVWWQNDAAAAVAATVSQCKLGNGKRRGVLSKGDCFSNLSMATLKHKPVNLVFYVYNLIIIFSSHSSTAELRRLLQPSKTDGTVSFLVIGDWGRRGSYNQSQVALQMGEIGEKLDIDFVISTGDNFYDNGLTSLHDPLFQDSFTNIYTAPSLQKPWYSVLGNHDYRGDVRAQLSPMLRALDNRWVCMRSFIVNAEIVDLFFVDTTPFVDKYFIQPNKHVYDWSGVLPRQTYLNNLLKELDVALRESVAKWKIVIGHHTIKSAGHHGNTIELEKHLLPILQANEVDLYVNGHDHCLEHISSVDSNIQFMTSGGGSKAWKGGDVNYVEPEEMRFYYDGQGFMSVHVSEAELRVVFYDVFGHVLHHWKKTYKEALYFAS